MSFTVVSSSLTQDKHDAAQYEGKVLLSCYGDDPNLLQGVLDAWRQHGIVSSGRQSLASDMVDDALSRAVKAEARAREQLKEKDSLIEELRHKLVLSRSCEKRTKQALQAAQRDLG